MKRWWLKLFSKLRGPIVNVFSPRSTKRRMGGKPFFARPVAEFLEDRTLLSGDTDVKTYKTAARGRR